MKLCLAFLAVVVAAFSQTSLSGVVRDAASLEPLEGVRVRAGDQRVQTDSLGSFTFDKLVPGRYWISALDEKRAASGGMNVLVRIGQPVTGVDIRLKVGGTISGRIVNDNNEPVDGAAVLLLERRYEHGDLVYAPRDTVTTSKTGEYRLERVPSDHGYFLLARKKLQITDTTPPDPEKRHPALGTVFYPGSPDARGAQPIRLASHEQRTGIDLRLPFERSYCIDGLAETPAGVTVSSVSVVQSHAMSEGWSMTPATAPVGSGGKFRVCGLPSGEYGLSGRVVAANRRLTATADVLIANRDVGDLRLIARPGFTLTGEVLFDRAPLDNRRVRADVMLRQVARDEVFADAQTRAGSIGSVGRGDRILVPGPLEINAVPSGTYDFTVSGLAAGCYVKEATYADADIRSGQIRIRGSVEGRIRVVIACDGGSLSARVSDREGNPVSNVRTFFMPAGVGSAAELQRMVAMREVEQGWSGQVESLPPGKYLVLASSLELDGTVDTITRLWNARSKAKEVSLAAGAREQATVEVVEIE